jgi:hypothetical protein
VFAGERCAHRPDTVLVMHHYRKPPGGSVVSHPELLGVWVVSFSTFLGDLDGFLEGFEVRSNLRVAIKDVVPRSIPKL